MVSEEELKWEEDIWSFDNIKKLASENCKLLLNKVGTYVICGKFEFLCFRFSIVTRFLNVIANLKDWPLVFSA